MSGDTYVNTYFHLDAGYVWGNGYSREQSTAFDDEVTALLGSIGFTVVRKGGLSGSCPEMSRGKENLYCHPMHLNGAVLEASVDEIARRLGSGKSFRLRNVETHERMKDYDIADLMLAVTPHVAEIRRRILDLFDRRGRRPWFVATRLQGLSAYSQEHFCVSLARRGRLVPNENACAWLVGFVQRQLDLLVDEGYVAKATGEGGVDVYRTLTNTERRRRKLRPLADESGSSEAASRAA